MIDLLIIGSGGAGLSAAIEAKEKGANVVVVTKQHITHAQTVQAQGGINAVVDFSEDSVEHHVEDTLKSSQGLALKSTIEFMCSGGEETISWLNKLGVPFSRDKNNQIARRKLGGAKYKRACYSSDYTGLKILHTLYDRCIKDDVDFLTEHLLLNIIVEKGKALGATLLDIVSGEVKQILAKTTILATGGYSNIYSGFTTNSSATTGDGIATALRAGCKLKNMEFIQFHPTALKKSKVLISESARGEGGYLVNSDDERFVDELLPRDKVARAIFEQLKKDKEVFLDIRHLGLEKIMESMPQEKELAKTFEGVDVQSDLIPIEPVAHYSMGGIEVDIDTKTNIENLYACGECAEIGVHGANRLGGNSLLEIVTFGRVSANNAIEKASKIDSIEEKEYKQYIKDKKDIEKIYDLPVNINFYTIKEQMGKMFYKDFGLFREDNIMNEGLSSIKQWKKDISNMGIKDKSKQYNQNLVEFIEFKNMLELCEIIALSAISRCESRGAHFRIDFPIESEEYKKSSLTYLKDEVLVSGFKEYDK